MLRIALGFALLLLSCNMAPTTPNTTVYIGTQQGFESGLDLTNITGNIRIGVTSAPVSSAQSITLFSAHLGNCYGVSQGLLNAPAEVNLNVLSAGTAQTLADAQVNALNYDYVMVQSADTPFVASMPAFTVEQGKTYVLVVALNVVLGKSFVKYIAEVSNAAIARVIYMDLDGRLAGVLPSRNACALMMTNPLCGNGILDPGEECDDGNRKDGDGCSSDCKIEAGFPVCKWTCDDPVCPALCEPVCEPPRCHTQCQPLPATPNCNCDVKCEKPECEIQCPDSGCESDSCPGCQIVCKPVRCVTHCQVVDPNGPHCTSPAPQCESLCEEPKCNWKCEKPNCPKPQCELNCENYAQSVCKE